MSNKPMLLASFMFLLAANANSVRATASGGVLIFGIHVSLLTMFPRSSPKRAAGGCLLTVLSGYTVTATTKVLVAVLRLAQ